MCNVKGVLMKTGNIFGLLILITSLFLSGCGGGGSDAPGAGDGHGTPTDTSIDFTIFPPNFFTNYSASADLTGTFTGSILGDVELTGSLTEVLQAQTTFLGSAAIPYLTTTTFTSTAGIGGTAQLTSYYNMEENNRRFLGVSGEVNIVSATTTAMPQTARIGESGNIGTYVADDGMTSVISWSLEDGFNGNAKLILSNQTNNASGAPDNTVTTTYLIQADGTRLSVELITFNDTVNITSTLSGDYN